MFPLASNQNTIADYAKRTPMHIACLIGNHASCSYLLQSSIEIDAKDIQGMTPLFICVIMGFVDLLRDLLSNGANISEQDVLGRTALHWGIITNSLECVYVLLDLPDCLIKLPDYQGNEPIHEAANIGNDELLNILIQMGCDPSVANDDGLTPLHLSCAIGSLACCTLLLSIAVPFNALDFSDHVYFTK